VADRRIHEAARAGYATAADVYARARPSYPAAAVDWLVEQLELRRGGELVEVGAGTGTFTALLVERGFRVVAVEPVAAMRQGLSELGDAVRVVDAVAQALPFADDSGAAVIASQSLHWADVDRAFAEFDRVLGADGAVGLIWNFRDLDVAWQRDLDALLSEVRGDAPHSRDGRWQAALASSPCRVASSASWRWSVAGTPSDVVDRVRSVSYVAALPDAEQDRIDRRVIEILASHGLGDSRRVSFPYMTEAYALRRR
jgi:SAM-dependent methyltransferase